MGKLYEKNFSEYWKFVFKYEELQGCRKPGGIDSKYTVAERLPLPPPIPVKVTTEMIAESGTLASWLFIKNAWSQWPFLVPRSLLLCAFLGIWLTSSSTVSSSALTLAPQVSQLSLWASVPHWLVSRVGRTAHLKFWVPIKQVKMCISLLGCAQRPTLKKLSVLLSSFQISEARVLCPTCFGAVTKLNNPKSSMLNLHDWDPRSGSGATKAVLLKQYVISQGCFLFF